MVPTFAVLKSLQTAFRTYVVAQLVAPGWSLMLLKAPFTPSPDLVTADVVPDPDTSVFPLAITDSSHLDGRDPATGDLITLYSAGAGVQAIQFATPDARTEYGWAILTAGTNILLASELLPTPLQIVSMDDEVRHPEIGFRLPMNLIR